MVVFIIGIILSAIPFVLVSFFPDKKQGFVYVLFFLLLFHSILGILVQTLGIFHYWVVLGCTLLADVGVILAYLNIRAGGKKISALNLTNIDWAALFVIIISLFSLWQVHFDYTGKISIAVGQVGSYQEVKGMVYEYPYFSDEWYAVSLVEGAIINHSLPIKNILENSFFPNLEIFFHSLIVQITVLLGLNPLLQYTILSIFFNSLIVILIYLFLRINNVSKRASAICSLSALYITCGATLPGLWHLIPFNLGIIFFLLGACFLRLNRVRMAIFAAILASFFYPPLFPFYFLGLAVFLWSRLKRTFLTKKNISCLLALILAMAVLIVVFVPTQTINYIFSRIFFTSFVAPMIPQFYLHNIIPLLAIIFGVPGIYCLYKNKNWVLLSEFLLGIIFWSVYAFTTFRFFAEYERVVVFTSIICVIISGFGLKQIEEYIDIKFRNGASGVVKFMEILALVIFLLLTPFYTRGENWRKLIYLNPSDRTIGVPRSPANNYLTDDDLRIFANIKNKRFLSIPWKGTVIGVATGNYPLLTKEGTISIGLDSLLSGFMSADCAGKEKIAKERYLDYIYIYSFACPAFQEIDRSKEGFILYKFIKNGA